MLIALGFQPLKAAVLALTANTVPVAFGGMATPIITLGKVTSLSSDTLGSMVGRQTPILALFVPLALVFIVDGRRGLRETWPVAVVCGVAFAVAQYVTSNFISVPLADVVASLVSAAVVVLYVRFQPAAVRPVVVAGGSVDEPTPEFAARVAQSDSRADVIRAYAPYAIIILVFVLGQINAIKTQLNKATHMIAWPGLHLVTATGKRPASSPGWFPDHRHRAPASRYRCVPTSTRGGYT
ncbi:MAG: L-lactate transport [Actinomycetia bacterium]|nr:L-lactate transport [Actinomycetes bacterium]